MITTAYPGLLTRQHDSFHLYFYSDIEKKIFAMTYHFDPDDLFISSYVRLDIDLSEAVIAQ